jgi:AcrR family transcriptional regulator
MAEPVKGPRAYHSPRRREQAAATRLQVLEAAERLFTRDGFAGTTMAAIAQEAGVAPRTVYVAFETKSGVLRALWNLRLRGDEEPAPVGERQWYRGVLEERDPERKLRDYAATMVPLRARIGGLLAVIRDAAPADTEVGALWQRMQTEFHANQRGIVQSLSDLGALRTGLAVDVATDILWTVNNPTVFLLLVHDRGWSIEAYSEWVADTACQQLLAPASAGRRRPVK